VIHKLGYGAKHILELDVPGQNLVVHPDDTFIVSYPKSGNTWTRFLIANLLQLEPPVTRRDMDRLVPAVDGQTRGFFKAMPRPRVIGDHGTFNPQYKNVIYIVRDPRDVVMSEYRFFLESAGIDESYPLTSFVNDFIRGVRSPVGSWAENVLSWLATRGNSRRFLLLHYEDMLSDTAGALADMASFLGIQVAADRLAEAATRSAPDNLTVLHKIRGDEDRHSRKQDIPVVMPAAAGGWRSTLPEVAVAEIESAWGPLMSKLGYELSV
jgi:hypothetical protein